MPLYGHIAFESLAEHSNSLDVMPNYADLGGCFFFFCQFSHGWVCRQFNYVLSLYGLEFPL